MKICHKCKVEKDNSCFYKDKSRSDGLCFRCKQCDSAASNAFREKNRERLIAKDAARYAKNKDLISEKKRIHYSENKEKYVQRIRIYKAQKPGIVTLCARNRRARVLSAEGSHTRLDVIEIFNSQKGLCASCNIKLITRGKNKYHVDHIKPLSKGGSNYKYNLQCLCAKCNISKGAKDPVEWARQNWKLI